MGQKQKVAFQKSLIINKREGVRQDVLTGVRAWSHPLRSKENRNNVSWKGYRALLEKNIHLTNVLTNHYDKAKWLYVTRGWWWLFVHIHMVHDIFSQCILFCLWPFEVKQDSVSPSISEYRLTMHELVVLLHLGLVILSLSFVHSKMRECPWIAWQPYLYDRELLMLVYSFLLFIYFT